MFKKGEMVKLKEPIMHFGTKEFIFFGLVVRVVNKYNPFKKTKYIILLKDAITDGEHTFSSFLDTFEQENIERIKL